VVRSPIVRGAGRSPAARASEGPAPTGAAPARVRRESQGRVGRRDLALPRAAPTPRADARQASAERPGPTLPPLARTSEVDLIPKRRRTRSRGHPPSRRGPPSTGTRSRARRDPRLRSSHDPSPSAPGLWRLPLRAVRMSGCQTPGLALGRWSCPEVRAGWSPGGTSVASGHRRRARPSAPRPRAPEWCGTAVHISPSCKHRLRACRTWAERWTGTRAGPDQTAVAVDPHTG